MRPGGPVAARVSAAGALMVFLTALGASGRSAADPDFPTIPATQPAEGIGSDEMEGSSSTEQSRSLETGGATESMDGLASGHDCVAIKYVVGRVNALMSGQVPISQRFASKELGEQAVDKDLDVLNQIEQYLVYAEPGVEDPAQRAKIEAYKAALGQVSTVLEDRRGQDLTRPAAYGWVGQFAEANSRASSSFLAIGNSCLA